VSVNILKKQSGDKTALRDGILFLTRNVRLRRCCPVSERLAKQTKRLVFCAVQLLSD